MKKKHSFIAIALSFAFISTVFSQNYDFNGYKYRFQKFRGFNTTVNFTGNHTSNKSTSKRVDDNPLNNINTSYQTPLASMAGNIGFSYFHYISTNRLQQSLTSNYFANFSRSSQVYKIEQAFNQSRYSTTQTFKNNKINANLNLNMENRWYKRNNQFFLLGLTIRADYDNEDSKTNIDSFNKMTYANHRQIKNTSCNFNLNIGGGIGRMEYVTDAIFTAFLVRDLIKKAGIENPTNDQFENITKGVSKIKNTRFIDYRFKLIDQIELLDTILKSNGISIQNTLRYYTSIYDNWLYANQFQRFSGNRFSYYLASNNRISNYFLYFEDTALSPHFNTSTIFINYQNGIALDYLHSTQKSLTVQQNYGVNLSSLHSLYQSKTSFKTPAQSNVNSNTKLYTLYSELQFKYGYLFQPNTRTFFETNINYQIQHIKNLKSANLFKEMVPKTYTLSNNIILNASAFRFVNARLAFKASINFSLYHNKFKSTQFYYTPLEQSVVENRIDKSNHYNFNCGVVYSLF